MSIPFIDLKTQYHRISDKVQKDIGAVLESCAFVGGPAISQLEERLAGFCGRRYGLACSSGTDALILSLMAIGVGPGDAVFCPPFTFMSTAEAPALLGATPVFVDIDPKTRNMDPEQFERAVRAVETDDASGYPLPKHEGRLVPKAVIPVDLFGLLADYPRILKTAKEHGIAVIEDAAQSFGASLRMDGGERRAGSFGHIGCTSFFPAKPLGCYGDGGMCFTDDEGLLEMLNSLRVHGQGSNKYANVRLGINGRMDTIQAAVLLDKFAIFEEEIRLRQDVVKRYAELLGPIEGLTLPAIPEGCVSVFAQYSICARDSAQRKELLDKLAGAGVPTSIYYPTPLHLQPAFAKFGNKRGDMPVSENLAARIFSIPMHPYLTEDVQRRIAAAMAA